MLAGNLAEFSLQDIFQLLALTNKSGVLRVTTDAREGRVYFRGGEVYFAVADVRRLPLGARLVAAGHLPEDRLRTLLDSRRGASAVELAAAVVEADVVDEATLDRLLREQVEEAVFSLARREYGDFSFDPDDQGADWAGASLTTDQLITEASHRRGEWTGICRQIPSPAVVLALAPNPAGQAEEVVVGRQQWQLLTLVDGTRTVGELVDLTGQGEFVTCKLVAGLIEAGLVEVADPSGQTTLGALLAGREALRRLEEVTLGGAPAADPPLSSVPTRPMPSALDVPAADPPAASPAAEPLVEEAPVAPRPPIHMAVAEAAADRHEASTGRGEDGEVPEFGHRPGPDGQTLDSQSLTRDEEINRALLLRLIDGVKGA